jgi:DNA-binding LacI/PurR family transcriptional regulator
MTIQDVTDRSGVFISTISRVVTGCVAVGFATAERIRRQLPS